MLKIVQNLNDHLKAERPLGETFHLRPSDFHKMLIIWVRPSLHLPIATLHLTV